MRLNWQPLLLSFLSDAVIASSAANPPLRARRDADSQIMANISPDQTTSHTRILARDILNRRQISSQTDPASVSSFPTSFVTLVALQSGSAIVLDPTEIPAATSTPSPNQSVLSILLSALPSSIVSELESQWSSPTAVPSSAALTGTHSRAPATASSSRTGSVSRSSTASRTVPASSSRHTSSVSTARSTSSSAIPSSSSSSSLSSSTTISSSRSTNTLSPSTSTSVVWDGHTPISTVSTIVWTAATHSAKSSSSGLSGGAIAGIVIGSILGAAFLIAGALYLLYRYQKRNAAKNRIFPESAWLYDPSPTPPRTPSIDQPLPPVDHDHEEPTLQPGPEHRTPPITMNSPGSTRSQRYVLSSPDQPQVLSTPNGDSWINPFADIPRHTLPLPSWYTYGNGHQ